MSRRLWVVVAGMVLVAAVAYIPALRGGFIWDDDAHVTTNLAMRSVQGLVRIWIEPGAAPQFYPMAHTGFWIQYQLFGEHPLGYKLVNLALHLTSASLLMLVLLRLGLAPWASGLAAVVFAVHPVHVESVAWISELKNTLSGVFYMAAALAYLHGLDRADRRWYWASLGLFVAALLSKTVTASLPAALLLALWWRQGRLQWSDVKPLIPFLVIGAGLGLFTVWFERHMVGARGEDFGFTLADRLLIAGRALWFYAGKLLWPHPLVFTYPRWVIDTGVWWQWLYPVSAAGLIATLIALRKRLGIGPLAAMLFFGGTLLPAIGFIDVYPFVFSFVADHFQYLASVGVIVLAACAVAALPHAARVGVSAAIVAALAAVTFAHGRTYRDLDTLYRHVLHHNPDSWMAHNNLGSLLLDRGETEAAVGHFERSLQLHPRNAGAMRNLALVHHSRGEDEQALTWYEKAVEIRPEDTIASVALGELYLRTGQPQRAKALFADAVEREPRNLLAWYNLGLMAMAEGDAAEAVRCLRQTLAIQADLSEAHYQLAHALLATGETAAAAEHFRKALAISGDDPKAMLGLGNALAAGGDVRGAIAQFRRAVEAEPSLTEAHYNLGLMLAMTGRPDEAISSLQRAVELDDNFADAHFQLATVLAQRGRLDEAAVHFQQAIDARPDFAEAHNNLGVVYAAGDRHELAADAHRRALSFRPDYADARLNLGIALMNLELYDEASQTLAPLTGGPTPPFAAAYQHGLALVALDRLDEAAKVLDKALRQQPGHLDAALLLADVQARRGEQAQARQLFVDIARTHPDSAVALRSLAWLIVTDPAVDPRTDAPVILEAIRFADRAHRLTGGDDPRSLDVLAATYAAAGRFTDAMRHAQIAHDLARHKGDAILAAAIEQRLDAYREGRRWTQPVEPREGG
jgi:tetratricopeptide (TPR) repeat protein